MLKTVARGMLRAFKIAVGVVLLFVGVALLAIGFVSAMLDIGEEHRP